MLSSGTRRKTSLVTRAYRLGGRASRLGAGRTRPPNLAGPSERTPVLTGLVTSLTLFTALLSGALADGTPETPADGAAGVVYFFVAIAGLVAVAAVGGIAFVLLRGRRGRKRR
jgi:hypothetical protein